MSAAKSKRADHRRTALLEAAATLFFEQGYAATRIDSIIERAGGSKRTIYETFGSKEGLFSALIGDLATNVILTLDPPDTGGRDLRAVLTAFGQRLMSLYMSPAFVGIYRTVIAEATRHPELGRTFFERGPARAAARLAERLEAAKAAGEIRVHDCSRLADHFMGLIRDNLHLEVVLGLRAPPNEAAMRRAVRSAVDVFLGGILPPAGQDKRDPNSHSTPPG